MPDMLVKLYDLPDSNAIYKKCEDEGIEIRRAMTPDRRQIVKWVSEHSSDYAAGECESCFGKSPVTCFIATRDKEILGYACYNATAKDFFGPMRVLDNEQGKGIGAALLLRSLEALKEEGYGYAIIGSVGPADFYTKVCGATVIEGSTPGIYKDFLRGR